MGIFIRCNCGSEGLYIEKDEEYDEVFVSLFYCSPYNISIKHKLNWIWQIIKGKPYADCVILDFTEAKEFIKKLEQW